jgi:hypothetical protein
MVDSIPVPGLSILIDLNAMMEEVVGDIEGNAIDAIIGKSVDQIKKTFDEAQRELGIPALKE